MTSNASRTGPSPRSLESTSGEVETSRGLVCFSAPLWKLTPWDWAASGSFSIAAEMSKPAARNPRDRPPHPANMSKTRGRSPLRRRSIFRDTADLPVCAFPRRRSLVSVSLVANFDSGLFIINSPMKCQLLSSRVSFVSDQSWGRMCWRRVSEHRKG